MTRLLRGTTQMLLGVTEVSLHYWLPCLNLQKVQIHICVCVKLGCAAKLMH